MPTAADVGQSVVAAILGLGAAGVAGGIVAMARTVHLQQIQLAERLARRDGGGPADTVRPPQAANGNGAAEQHSNGTTNGRGTGHGNGHAIEGPDSVFIGEQVRYRVHRSEGQRVVAWAAGGGAVSQASDPAHPDDLLLVAAQPGTLMVSVRLREGIAERRETKAVTAVASPAMALPATASPLFLQEWTLTAVVVVIVGFAAALVALGSLEVGGFIALVAPLAAMLVVVTATRRHQERPGQSPPPL
jgi:hypothetical protein